MEHLNFAPHPSLRKQAATSEIDTAFNMMKMRLLQSYVSNCVQSANVREERGDLRSNKSSTTCAQASGDQIEFRQDAFFGRNGHGKGLYLNRFSKRSVRDSVVFLFREIAVHRQHFQTPNPQGNELW